MIKKNIFLVLLIPAMLFVSGKPPIVNADFLVKRYSNTSDTTYIINFWATWCPPCVKELPNFEKLNANYKGKKVKVILVSMDFLTDYDSKLIPYLQKNNIKSEVMMLNETKPDEFINKINPKWQGSIPSTMIVNGKKKYNEFLEKPLTYEELEAKVKASGN